MNESRIRPSRAAYVLPALILVGGAYGFLNVLSKEIGGMEKGLIQMTVPGDQVFALTKTGTYTIFHEYESVMDGRVYSSRGVTFNMKCTVTAEATGEEISVTHPSMSSSYTVRGRAGESVLEFQIKKPGNYGVACRNSDETTEPLAVFAIGHDFAGSLYKTIFLGLFFGFGSLAAAGGGFCGIWWMREKSKARRTGQTPGAPPANVPLG